MQYKQRQQVKKQKTKYNIFVLNNARNVKIERDWKIEFVFQCDCWLLNGTYKEISLTRMCSKFSVVSDRENNMISSLLYYPYFYCLKYRAHDISLFQT